MHWVNGLEIELVSIQDRGLLYGDGLFETMLCNSGTIQLLAYHLERLESGCKHLHMDYPQAAVLDQLSNCVSAVENANILTAVIRLTVTRGSGPRGYPSPSSQNPTIIISASSAPVQPQGKRYRLHLCDTRLGIGSPVAGLKHLNRLEQVLAATELEQTECDEGVLLDYEGNVISGARSNLFIVADSVLHTPALDRCGIAGTVRRLIIEELSPNMNLSLKVGALSVAQIEAAKEIFYTNSIIGVRAVSDFNGCTYENFTVADAMAEALKNAVEGT